MKAKFLLLAVFACVMAFTACTQEKIVYVEKEDISGENDDNALENIELKPGEGIIKISLSNGLSRAPRPIISNEPTNNVNRILFKFVKSGGIEYTDFKVDGAVDTNGKIIDGTTISDNQNVLNLTNDIYQSDNEIYVKFSGLKPDDGTNSVSYKILAFGYNVEDGTSEGLPFTLTKVDGGTYYKCSFNKQPIEELFAGAYDNANVNKFGLFEQEITITLTRQVAALVAYLKNVPVKVNKRNSNPKEPMEVKRITITTPFKIEEIYVPRDGEYNGVEITNNLEDSYQLNYENVKYETFDHLLTFDLTSDDNITVDENGKYYEFISSDGEKTYLRAEENDFDFFNNKFGNTNGGKILEPMENTMFGSRFIYAYPNGIHLRYFGTLIICYWGKGQDSDSEYELIDYVSLKNKFDSDKDFMIKRNRFYKIGDIYEREETGEDNPMDIDMASGYETLNVIIDNDYDDTLDLINPETNSPNYSN